MTHSHLRILWLWALSRSLSDSEIAAKAERITSFLSLCFPFFLPQPRVCCLAWAVVFCINIYIESKCMGQCACKLSLYNCLSRLVRKCRILAPISSPHRVVGRRLRQVERFWSCTVTTERGKVHANTCCSFSGLLSLARLVSGQNHLASSVYLFEALKQRPVREGEDHI